MASKREEIAAYKALLTGVAGRACALKMEMRSWYDDDDPSYAVYIAFAPIGIFTDHRNDPMEAVQEALAELAAKIKEMEDNNEQ